MYGISSVHEPNAPFILHATFTDVVDLNIHICNCISKSSKPYHLQLLRMLIRFGVQLEVGFEMRLIRAQMAKVVAVRVRDVGGVNGLVGAILFTMRHHRSHTVRTVREAHAAGE
jgi:hypothetical protein